MQCLGGSPGHCTSQHRPAPVLHMISFEKFVKSMPPSLSKLKVTPSFCFAFKIYWPLGEVIMFTFNFQFDKLQTFFFQQRPQIWYAIHLPSTTTPRRRYSCFEKLPPLPMSFNNLVDNILPFFATLYLPLRGHLHLLHLHLVPFLHHKINKVEHLLFPSHGYAVLSTR